MVGSIDVWAIPLNTALLIILALIQTYIARKQRAEHRDLVDVKRSIGLDRRYDDGRKNGNPPHDTGERRRISDRRGE